MEQQSKIPIRRTGFNYNSGNSSSPRNEAEKNQSRLSGKSATAKRSDNSGYSGPVTESTTAVIRRRLPTTPSTPLEAKQVSKDKKEPHHENAEVSTSCADDYKKKYEQLEKEHFEIVAELQQWIEDGDKKNKALEEVIDKNNKAYEQLEKEHEQLEKEHKQLEKEHSEIVEELQQWIADGDQRNKTLDEVVEKNSKAYEQLEKEHYEIVEELQKWIDDGDEKNKTLEEVIAKNNKAYEQLEKEHSEIVEELQQWITDGDQRNKTLEEVVEKTNEENYQLLIQTSDMKKEVKALESKKVDLQSELAMKRADVKYLKNKECYSERELRNLKRDLKKKQQNVEEHLREEADHRLLHSSLRISFLRL